MYAIERTSVLLNNSTLNTIELATDKRGAYSYLERLPKSLKDKKPTATLSIQAERGSGGQWRAWLLRTSLRGSNAVMFLTSAHESLDHALLALDFKLSGLKDPIEWSSPQPIE